MDSHVVLYRKAIKVWLSENRWYFENMLSCLERRSNPDQDLINHVAGYRQQFLDLAGVEYEAWYASICRPMLALKVNYTEFMDHHYV